MEERDELLMAAKKLADALRAKRAYTNTATFDLKCQVGGAPCLRSCGYLGISRLRQCRGLVCRFAAKA